MALPNIKGFFEYMYKVWMIWVFFDLLLQFNAYFTSLRSSLCIFLCLQCEIYASTNVDIKLYYEKMPKNWEHFQVKLQKWMEKVMEQVWKDEYFAFCKHMLVCDFMFGHDFLKEIQLHYNMNS